MSTVWPRELDGQRAFFPDPTNEKFLFSSEVGTLCFRFCVERSAPTGASGARSHTHCPYIREPTAVYFQPQDTTGKDKDDP